MGTTDMFKQIVLAACLVALAAGQAQMTCDECTRMARGLGELTARDSTQQAMLDVITGPVCGGLEEQGECEDALPKFWRLFSTRLFTADDGWWDPKFICSDVCGQQSLLRSVRLFSCIECDARIQASADYLSDEGTILNVVEQYQNNGFCEENYPEGVEECNVAVEYVVPIAFPELGAANRAWILEFCTNDMSCV